MDIVLFTVGSAGDVLPFVRVGSALASAGHAVTLLSHFGYQQIAEAAGLRFEAIDKREEYQAFLGDMPLLNKPRDLPRFLIEHVLKPAPQVLDIINKHADHNTVMITPPLYDVAPRLARRLFGLRLMWLCIAPAQATALPLQAALYRKVLGNDINELRQELGLGAVTDWDQWLSYSSPAIGLWPDWFGAPEPGWLAGLTPVGFAADLPAERQVLPEAVSSFLDDHAKPLLITGGTGNFHGRRFYGAALDAVEDLDHSCILVTRSPQELPEHLPRKTLVVEQASFGLLLPLVGLIVHHGGVGTTAAAVGAGIPQLILAYGVDRPDNGARIAKLGLGSVMPPPKWQRQDVAEAIRVLLNSKETLGRCQQFRNAIAAHDTSLSINRVVADYLQHQA